MKIITLIDNLVYTNKLVAEHGLSMYIETANLKILFDTGQSGLFLQNAKTLGIAVEEIDAVVLSHGHYDHTGGLYKFLEQNNKAKVYAKQSIFTPKYNKEHHFIGTELNEALLNERLVYIKSITELDEDIFIFPDIPVHHPVDIHFKGFTTKAEGQVVPDEFDDELFMVIRQKNHINVITACSHRGITNICTTATGYFNLPTRMILGGFHIKDCTMEQYVHITHYLRLLQPRMVGVCHCTGIKKYAELLQECEAHLFYNEVGNIVNL
jgi:7,8-dihydropterin-6-yl-methyl-4-(beta-D-ribofuranosyl)aminobenzene 5'-phosphate synthase